MTDHATHVMRTPDGLVIVPFYGCAECNAAVAAAGAHNRRAALAADVARAWVTYRADWGPGSIDAELAELLDRLAAAHTIPGSAPSPAVIRCCTSHVPGPAGACCDPDDCGPCCADCPTCPTEHARKAR